LVIEGWRVVLPPVKLKSTANKKARLKPGSLVLPIR